LDGQVDEMLINLSRAPDACLPSAAYHLSSTAQTANLQALLFLLLRWRACNQLREKLLGGITPKIQKDVDHGKSYLDPVLATELQSV
jgi:hypothetical protein